MTEIFKLLAANVVEEVFLLQIVVFLNFQINVVAFELDWHGN